MTEHELKSWPIYFRDVAAGIKTFEIRINDRGFVVGDVLRLREWDPDTKFYTGREVRRRVAAIYDIDSLNIGVRGFVAMEIRS